MIKKNLILGLIIFLMLLLPSISAYSFLKDDGFFVKTNSNIIKEQEPQKNLVDRIFNNMKEKIRLSQFAREQGLQYKKVWDLYRSGGLNVKT